MFFATTDEWPVRIRSMSLGKYFLSALDKFWVGFFKIVRLSGIGAKVVNFNRLIDPVAHGFPIAEAGRLHRVIGWVKFPVEIIAFRCLSPLEITE